eukprot:TRINITY_DN4663_c0_g1_i17.p2 TRINITY_DN4663_c0_g1~~TRINITY_DN4663_c0_g1_i17.p2  ORF type:complete len:100 (+),score=14.22 TRINITY_DN4663_c0_g1_i17:75-374(+)
MDSFTCQSSVPFREVSNYLLNREIGCRPYTDTHQQWCREKATKRIPFMKEASGNLQVLCDKIFASHWLDDKLVATGSKDNKVNLFSTMDNYSAAHLGYG